MSIKYTYEFVKTEFEKYGYTLIDNEYINCKTKINCVCPNGHKYSVRFTNFKNGQRCKKCLSENLKISYNNVKNEFNKYGYTLLSKSYKSSKYKLDTICPNGHSWLVSYNNFNQGKRCRQCYVDSRKTDFNIIKKEFIKCNYILLTNNYINAATKMEYICDKGHYNKVTWNSFYHRKARCKKCYIDSISNENSKFWKGGYRSLNLPLYDTYAIQLEWIEKVRRDPENNDILQVRCSELNCERWFTPTIYVVHNRLASLSGSQGGENRFYCSDKCKNNCSIFHRSVYPKNYKPDYSRELQPELRDLVLQRDEYECQRCGSDTDLHCHHFEGIEQNPIESADIDNCITLCSECHKMAHENEGCRYVDLRKDKICNNEEI